MTYSHWGKVRVPSCGSSTTTSLTPVEMLDSILRVMFLKFLPQRLYLKIFLINNPLKTAQLWGIRTVRQKINRTLFASADKYIIGTEKIYSPLEVVMPDETRPQNGSYMLSEALKIIVTGLIRRKNRIATSSGAAFSHQQQVQFNASVNKCGKFSTKDLPSASNKACMTTPKSRKSKAENMQ